MRIHYILDFVVTDGSQFEAGSPPPHPLQEGAQPPTDSASGAGSPDDEDIDTENDSSGNDEKSGRNNST